MQDIRKYFATAILISLAQAVPFSSVNESFTLSRATRDAPINYHLPKNIIPTSYKIFLNPNFDDKEFTFNGISKININVQHATKVITMHAKNISVNPHINLNCDLEKNVTVCTVKTVNDNTDFLKIILDKELPEGSNCNLTLKYSGKGNEGNEGFFRTSYETENGEKRWTASTRFRFIGARQVFPCWDEPSFRANFVISVKHKKKYIALSNMQLQKLEIDTNDYEKVISHFAQSPNMSPHMVALTIGDFVIVNNQDEEFRMWILRNSTKNGNVDYAFRMGKRLMESLGDYLHFPYRSHHFIKMDAVLTKLPPNFISIDHWGLVTYEMDKILINDDWSSTAKKDDVAMETAREIANQWFGNLVFPKWYNSIWLSEGLASYFQYAMIDQIEPTWRMMDRFVRDNVLSTAFAWDSLADTQAIEYEWKSPDDLRNPIHTSTFAKFASIIRTIHYILGEEKFRKATSNYLRTRAFGSVTSDDLFKEFTNVNTYDNINFLEILKNWITVPGYPVINVTRNYETEKAIITQSRFLDKNVNTTTERYWIPINFAIEENLDFNSTIVTHWFDPSKSSMEINDLKNNQFVIFNKQMFGFYRVNYDEKNWELITNFLKNHKHTDVHVLNRAQLIEDSFQLAKLGRIKYTVVLKLMEYLENETDFIPWSVAWSNIRYIHNYVINTEFDKSYKDYIVELSRKLVNEVQNVQLHEADHIIKLKRVEALQGACFFGSRLCRSEATRKLVEWLDNPEMNALLPDEKEWIICAGIRNADGTIWKRLWEKYINDKNRQILIALGCTSDVKILNDFLYSAITNSSKYSDFQTTIEIILEMSEIGPSVALDFLIAHYTQILNLEGYTSDDFQSTLTYLGYKIRNRVQRDKLQRFILDNEASLNGIADDVLVNVERILKKTDSEQAREIKSFLMDRENCKRNI